MSLPRLVASALCFAFLAAHLSAQSPLNITTTSFPQGTVGQSYNLTLLATGGTTPYTWSWSSTTQLPQGLVLNPNGSVTGTPTAAGTYNFFVTVLDARTASVSRIFSLTITGSTNRLSVATSTLSSATVGQNYSDTLQATGGTPPYRWTAGQGFPAFLTLTANTGGVAGTPTVAGTFAFNVQVTDSSSPGVSTTGTVTLVVTTSPLTITTVPPIFAGTVGAVYSQSFQASGGQQPYTWSIVSGNAGNLTLDPSTGNLQGTPQNAGSFNFTVQVVDKAGAVASQSYSLVVNQPPLTLTLGVLAAGTVGTSYSQKLGISVIGGQSPYTYSLTTGSSPAPGLSFDPASQIISGVPTSAGTFNFTLQVNDASGLSATRPGTLLINAASLSLTTSRQLPDGTLNQPYSQVISASGGQAPYRWSATGLPAGLSINSTTGQISGTIAAAGTFGIAITVIDNALASASDRFSLNVNLPPTPGASISGLPASIGPAQQFSLQVALDAPFPAPIDGQAVITFSPDSGPGDRTIQFATGGTTATFNIPAGGTTADLPQIQTGTVSGQLTVSLRLQAGGIDITPSPVPSITGQMGRGAPVIRGIQVNRSGNTVNLVVTGFSTAREVTQAVFAFSAGSGQILQPGASSITVDVNTLFGNWFQDPNNSQFGSVFVFTQPFTVQGDPNAVVPVSVTLTNRVGSTVFSIQQ